MIEDNLPLGIGDALGTLCRGLLASSNLVGIASKRDQYVLAGTRSLRDGSPACSSWVSVEPGSLEVSWEQNREKVTTIARLIDSMLWAKSKLHLTFAFAFLLSTATADTQFSFDFPSFSPESQDDFLTFRDAAYDIANRSYIINAGARTLASRGSFGALFYGKAVHIQNGATGRVASFSTSFSFTFTKHGLPWDYSKEGLQCFGFSFAMTTTLEVSGRKWIPMRTETDEFTPPGFQVNFETSYLLNLKRRLSSNFIRVAKNLEHEYDLEAYTHNLCGNDTDCSYFSNGRILTAWIDFDSSSQTLEIRMVDASDPKPSQPLLIISNYKFPKSVGDEVYLSFWGNSYVHRLEEHELLSWSFFSTGISVSKLQLLLHYLRSRTWVSVTTGGVLFATLAASVILWCIFTPSTNYSALGYSTGPRVFSYNELRKATQNFHERNVLGRGGSGVVYKGSFEGGGVCVAVKQINMLEDKQAQVLFHAEVASLGQIRHRNVVSLYGWCQEKGKLLLVYEYLPNGTLNDWLYKNRSQEVLSLKMRHSILEGVGAALGYLHEDCVSCVLHRDIKSGNVLLDANFKAYIGDFGLARLIDHHKLDKTTLAAGTFGYMAPELLYTGKATKESDVYSFGILVLEVVCGRHPLNLRTIEHEDLLLLSMIWRAHEGGSLFSMVDPRMLGTFGPSSGFVHVSNERLQVPGLPSHSSNLDCSTSLESIVVDVNPEIQRAMVVSLLQLGLFCCLPNPKARPSMGEVNRILHQIRDIEYESPITTILMPSLPDTKPLGNYDSLEFSPSSSSLSSSIAPSPTSLV